MTKAKHGTRSRYTQAKCRCEECRKANRDYYHERQGRIRAVISSGLDQVKNKKRNRKVPRTWTTPEGEQRTRYFKRRCPGVNGVPCKTYLRKDSVGGLCGGCREALIHQDQTVNAEAARDHMKFLSHNGVGVGAVRLATGISRSTLQGIRRGEEKITKETERKILSVSVVDKAPKALVDARPTQRLVRELMRTAHMSKAEIATRIYGRVTLALQLNKKTITVKNARAVEQLYRQTMRELQSDPGVTKKRVERMLKEILEETRMSRSQLAKELGWANLKLLVYYGYVRTSVFEEVKTLHEKYVSGVDTFVETVDLCLSCGRSHNRKDRLDSLRRLLPCTTRDIYEAYPCVYPYGGKRSSSMRLLHRDLHEVAQAVGELGKPRLWVPLESSTTPAQPEALGAPSP